MAEHRFCDVCGDEFSNPSLYTIAESAEKYERSRQDGLMLVFFEDNQGGYFEERRIDICRSCYNRLMLGYTLRGEKQGRDIIYYIND